MQRKVNIAKVDCERHRAVREPRRHGVSDDASPHARSQDRVHRCRDKASSSYAYLFVLCMADFSFRNMQAIDAPDPRIGQSPLLVSLGVLPTPTQNDIAKTSQFLLGSPLVYVYTALALLAFEYKDARQTTLSAFELSHDVFQQVMYAMDRPLVLVVATPYARQEAISTKLTEVPQRVATWYLRGWMRSNRPSGSRTCMGSRWRASLRSSLRTTGCVVPS